MNAEQILSSIRGELGDPQTGPLAEAMPLIEAGVRKALGEKPSREARITKPAETRTNKDDATT